MKTPDWKLEQDDCLAKMKQFIPKTFQLTMTSPPYFGKLRRYGGKGPLMTLIEYANWQVECIMEAVRITDGVVLWVANNPVIGGHYKPANELIIDVVSRHSEVVVKRPIIWHKNAGSSAKDWLRNDYEQILVFGNAKSKLHCDWMQIAQPKKFKTGGVYRQRNQTGTRVVGGKYPKNVFANPGDVLFVDQELDLVEVFQEVLLHGDAYKISPSQELRLLQEAIDSQTLRQWSSGIREGLRSADLLQQKLHGSRGADSFHNHVPYMQKNLPAAELRKSVLFDCLCGDWKEEEDGRRGSNQQEPDRGPDYQGKKVLRKVPNKRRSSRSPQGRRHVEQQSGELAGALPNLPRNSPQSGSQIKNQVQRLWEKSGKELQEIWSALRHALPEIKKTWFSALSEIQSWDQLGIEAKSDVIRCTVGGGQMGYDKEDDKLACSGFAPYPYNLADQLVRVFSKPGDCVFDPFAGTCTTGVAALVNERDFVGVDNDPAAIKVGQTRLARAISCPPLPDED